MFAILASADAHAVEVRNLYRAETIVTGREAPERLRGFQLGLAQVIVKLSGDAEAAQADATRQLLARADRFVESYEYEDRMKGIPIHDEQGTRDRPYFLRMTFERSAVDQALATFGFPRWQSDRPRVMVWLGVRDLVRSYVLTTTTEVGYGQRETLNSVARERGIPIALPKTTAQSRIDYRVIADSDVARLRAAAKNYAADAVLFGTLRMNDQGYWTLRWTLDWQGRRYADERANVTFDVALRAALERCAKIFATSAHDP